MVAALNSETKRMFACERLPNGSLQEPSCHPNSPSAELKRRFLTGDRVARKYRMAAVRRAEYRRLKAIVPAVAKKRAVSKLTVIEEAIKYIDQLHSALAHKVIRATNNNNKDMNSTNNKTIQKADDLVKQLFARHLMQNKETAQQKIQQQQTLNHHTPDIQFSNLHQQQQQQIFSAKQQQQQQQLYQQNLLQQQQRIKCIQEYRQFHLQQLQQQQQEQQEQQQFFQSKSCIQRQPLSSLHQAHSNLHTV